jgi:hypothetical protein
MLLGGLACCALPAEAAADPRLPHAGTGWGLFAAVEQFEWREFDAGTRLLEESGPRIHLGAQTRMPLRADSPVTLDARGSLYFGSVDYDGQACNIFTGVCTPLTSDTNYFGVLLDAVLRWPVGAGQGFEVIAGGGLDAWTREIEGTATAAGVTEDWTVLYLKAGIGYRPARLAGFELEAGVKYPFYADDFNDFFGVSVSPRGRGSLFARLSQTFGSGERERWSAGVYYDSYRFAASDPEGALMVFQPESEQDVIGVQVAVSWR